MVIHTTTDIDTTSEPATAATVPCFLCERELPVQPNGLLAGHICA